MKKTTTIAALSVAALLSAAPLLVSADDDCREDDRYEHRGDSRHMGNNLKKYSVEEMQVMAHGQALRRFGPGVEVAVNETADGTFQVQLRDSGQNLIREQEFNQYGAPVRGGRHN